MRALPVSYGSPGLCQAIENSLAIENKAVACQPQNLANAGLRTKIRAGFAGGDDASPLSHRRVRHRRSLNMPNQLTLQTKSSLTALQDANHTVSRWLIDLGAPAEIQHFANLAIEEFGTNLIKYGYDDINEHLIEVGLSLYESKLVLTIIDDGRAFNPLEAPQPKVSVPVGERPIGGLGIYLVRKMSDRMEYVREGNKNRLTLQKAFLTNGLVNNR